MRNRKNIVKNFIKKIYGKEIKVIYKKGPSSGLNNTVPMKVCVGPFKFMHIYQPWLISKHTTIVEIKSFLLHEIGHIKTSHRLGKSTGYEEFMAQRWAINKAKKLNMRSIELLLIFNMIAWNILSWKSSNRIYKMAYKMGVKKKLIPDIFK